MGLSQTESAQGKPVGTASSEGCWKGRMMRWGGLLGSGISETPRAWASMWAAPYSVGDMRGQGVGRGLPHWTLGGFAPRKRLAYLH